MHRLPYIEGSTDDWSNTCEQYKRADICVAILGGRFPSVGSAQSNVSHFWISVEILQSISALHTFARLSLGTRVAWLHGPGFTALGVSLCYPWQNENNRPPGVEILFDVRAAFAAI